MTVLIPSSNPVATAHAHLYAFTGAISQGKNSLAVLQDLTRWDRYTHVMTVSIIIWIADSLAIYRCYIVWQRSWKVVLVPALILLLSVGITLIYIIRIIIESAMIYTLQMLILVVLFRVRHRAMVIFQTTLAPSASIVFILMIARVEMAKSQDREEEGEPTSFKLPAWLDASSPSSTSDSLRTIEGAVAKDGEGQSDKS
ncbi:hypothetical protein H1R20_g5973, partial [Candolleomyces eurysporus]